MSRQEFLQIYINFALKLFFKENIRYIPVFLQQYHEITLLRRKITAESQDLANWCSGPIFAAPTFVC